MLNFDEIVRALDDEIVAEAVDNPSAVADLPETGTGTEPETETETEEVTDVAPAVSPQGSSRFLDLLNENEAYRQQQKAEWDRREKEAKSRKTWAAVADAVSSLGNLVGTTAGASNQPQTYQMPFVNQDVEQDRAYARTIADRIRTNEQAIQLQLAKQDAAEASGASALALQQLRNAGAERRAVIAGEYGLKRTEMQQEGANKRSAAAIEGANQRNADAIASRENEGARNRASREKIAADKIAQLDRAAKARESSSRKLTENAKAQKILKDAEMGVLSDLKSELEKNDVQLPYNWAKDWRKYVKLAPNFYKTNFIDKGWGDLGGKISDVSPEKEDEIDWDEAEDKTDEIEWE